MGHQKWMHQVERELKIRHYAQKTCKIIWVTFGGSFCG